MTERFDLIVVGAGPAGTTLATLVKKYRPGSKILIIEKERFPRHHVGESLLPGMVPVLKEMGVFEKINRAGFPKKFGVVFVWGEDREPWDADFNNLNLEMLEKYGRLLDTEFSWQVLRSRYDEILLRHAESCGVEAWLGARAVEPIEKEGRIVGLVVEREGGETSRLECRTLADCSGQNGFLSRVRGARKYRDELKNVAAYSYFKGARWKFEYAGHPDKTKIFVCSVPEGWFWYIPLASDQVSVGLVAKADFVKESGVRDMRDFFMGALRRCAEIWPLLENAELMKGVDPRDLEKDFFTAGDWSYENERAVGEGWIAAGDAAFFIDPLLSSGVMMAHLTGHRAAYTVLTSWEESDKELGRLLGEDYDRFCREAGASFLSLVQYWYGNDPNARAWRREARAAVEAATPMGLDDKLSFVAVASGLNYYFERAYTSQSFLFGASGTEHSWQWEGTKLEIQGWTRQILAIVETGFLKRDLSESEQARDAESMVALQALPDHWVPAWRLEREVETTFLPGSDGRLKPIRRLKIRRASGSAAADPRRILPAPLLVAAELVDGRRTVSQIKSAIGIRFALPAEAIDGLVFRFLKDMAVLGALSFAEHGLSGQASEPAPQAWDALRRGEARLRSGDPAAAEALLTLAIEGGAAAAWAWAQRGEARRHLGRFLEAAADFDEAIDRLDSGSRAVETSDRLGALAAELEREIERSWIEDRVRLFRAKLKLQTGDLDGAGAEAEASLRINPRQSEALALRAKWALARGAFDEARADIEAARAIETSSRRNER